MSTNGLQETPRLNFSETFAPGDAQLRLGAQYLGHFGFRRLLLAETVVALMEQQTPAETWHLRSAVVTFTKDPHYGPASIETVHRPVLRGSLLSNLRIVQRGQPIVTCVGASERQWRVGATTPAPAPDLGTPHEHPRLENWPEDTGYECRDASARLSAADDRQILGGFARRRDDHEFGVHDVFTLIEPWFSMPDPEGRWRDAREIVLEIHAKNPLSRSDASGYFKVLVERSEWIPGAERLVGSVWTFTGVPIATAYVSANLST